MESVGKLVDSRLWTEKYRPKSVDALDCPDFLKNFLKHALEHGFPNLLLYGPPGTGKTTFASLLNPTLELNASDDRGIDIIRNKVKKMANTVTPQVILLDECENLTRDAQTCLRRILEDYPNTRFIFCTNYYSKIIDPLKSRLLKLRFTLKESKALEMIGKSEGMHYNSLFYVDLFKKCDKDLRRCVNVLQGLKPLENFDIDDIVGVIPNKIVETIFKIDFSTYLNFVDMLLFEGYSVGQFIKQISEMLPEAGLTDVQRCEIVKTLSEAESKTVMGCSDELVLIFICLNVISAMRK
ncbi:hypothetical protein GINT2_001174 [Glugoides intestinalis]